MGSGNSGQGSSNATRDSRDPNESEGTETDTVGPTGFTIPSMDK